jgi:hypothetical protein
MSLTFLKSLFHTLSPRLSWCIVSGLLCTTSVMYGQGRWGIRVNQNTDLFNVTYEGYLHSVEERQVRFGRFSAGLNYTRNKVTHELELFVPEINASADRVRFPWPQELRRDTNFASEVSSYSLRYALMRNVHSHQRLQIAFGFAVNPYYLKAESFPLVENVYYAYKSILGASLNLMPAISFRASKHVALTVDCPFKVADFYRRTINVKNPAIPIHQQKTHNSETTFFMSAYTVRVGLSYTFSSERK